MTMQVNRENVSTRRPKSLIRSASGGVKAKPSPSFRVLQSHLPALEVVNPELGDAKSMSFLVFRSEESSVLFAL